MKKTVRIMAAALVLCLALSLLTACGTVDYEFKISDKPKHTVRINCDKTAALARWPHFKESDNMISMSFNGETWYTLKIVSAESVEKFIGEVEPAAETSNMRLYYTDSVYYSCSYIMDLDPEGRYFLKFDSNFWPEGLGYGDDFTTGIRYYLDETELIPDIPVLRDPIL